MSGFVQPTDDEIAMSVMNELRHDGKVPIEVSHAAMLVMSYLEDKTR